MYAPRTLCVRQQQRHATNVAVRATVDGASALAHAARMLFPFIATNIQNADLLGDISDTLGQVV
eukprot:COSAG02_NODE_7074_length_3196_cov_3.087405_3_plen_64_part_00